MRYYIGNHLIKADMGTLIKKIREETGRPLFKSEKLTEDSFITNCPIHKNGQERNPSFSIFTSEKSDTVRFGTCHCLACGYTASLARMVADCFRKPITFGKEWLIKNFGKVAQCNEVVLEPLEVNLRRPRISKEEENRILKPYDFYHPYMWTRKLSKEIVDLFRVGYDKQLDAITFPVWDEHSVFQFLTKRSTQGKRFYIEKGVEKPVYLLNYIIKNNITTVYVTESQINCLYLWTLGYPAVALFGTGTSYQLSVLRKSGIRHYILCFDGDEAGDKGTTRFLKNMNKDALISRKVLPRGKDCNDLSAEEFEFLPLEDL